LRLSTRRPASSPDPRRQGRLSFVPDELAGVPTIGVDIHFAAAGGRDGYELVWNER